MIGNRAERQGKTFIFQLTDYPFNNTYDIFFLDIPRIFLEQNMIYHGYF